jgi:hypothetical protein
MDSQLAVSTTPATPSKIQQLSKDDRIRAIAGGEIDPEAVERLTADEAAARAAGFAPRPPVYALGTRVIALGAQNFRRSRQEFEQLPPAKLVLAKLIERVLLERRADTEAEIRSIEMLPDGRVTRGGAPLALTETSFRQLLSRTDFPQPSAAATYLSEIPVERRVREVNLLLKATPEGRTGTIRHRDTLALEGNGREAFAIVSSKYVAMDADKIARLVLEDEVAPGDARGEVRYDGMTAEILLRWHSDVQPEMVAAGEIFRAFAGFRTADDGTMSLIPVSGLDRNLCLNLLIIDTATQQLGRKRHTGNNVASFMARALTEAVDSVRYFAERWDAARSTSIFKPGVVRDIPVADDGGSQRGCSDDEVVRGVFRGLIAGGKLALPGQRREAAIETLMGAFFQEPEYTLAGIANAITRAAHQAELHGAWAAESVQAAGGQILTSKRPLQWVGEGMDF